MQALAAQLPTEDEQRTLALEVASVVRASGPVREYMGEPIQVEVEAWHSKGGVAVAELRVGGPRSASDARASFARMGERWRLLHASIEALPGVVISPSS